MFHILRGPDAVGAVWAAQRVPDGGVAAVANAFTLRALAFDDAENFRVSANARDAAQAAGWWSPSAPEFDFTAVFADGAGPQYASGRRMWRIYALLAPATPFPSECVPRACARAFVLRAFVRIHVSPPLPTEDLETAHIGESEDLRLPAPESPCADNELRLRALTRRYEDYIGDAPYPTWTLATPRNISRGDAFGVMRDFYSGTPYALDAGMAGGFGGTPERWAVGAAGANVTGAWERAISLYRSQVAFVLQVLVGSI